jgi:hypothetical protein
MCSQAIPRNTHKQQKQQADTQSTAPKKDTARRTQRVEADTYTRGDEDEGRRRGIEIDNHNNKTYSTYTYSNNRIKQKIG